jgi:hypothetical protein
MNSDKSRAPGSCNSQGLNEEIGCPGGTTILSVSQNNTLRVPRQARQGGGV